MPIPKQTTLYRLVQQHAATFFVHTEAAAGAVPAASCTGDAATVATRACRLLL